MRADARRRRLLWIAGSKQGKALVSAAAAAYSAGMVYFRALRRFAPALLAASLAGASLLPALPAAAQASSDAPPPETAEPPLSEREIFPHIDGSKPQAGGQALKGNAAASAAKLQAEQDKLFAKLKRCADVKKAEEISRSIEGLWAQSGSDSIDLLMFWANKEIAAKNYAIALDFLDNAVALAPNYAEGWQRRASVHLMTNDIALAMVELRRVLQLEPRHYNAMLQLGAVLEMTERPEEALAAYEKALQFYPQMQSAQRRIQALAEKDSPRAI